MNASDLMTRDVQSCCPSDNLQRAMQIMWERDCGVVPVVDGENKVVGMVTDRDVSVAAYTQGQPLWAIPVSSAMARHVHGVREDDDLEAVETLMRRTQIRRVPVLDAEGRLKGLLSMNDLARHVHRGAARKADGLRADSIAQTLAAVCGPHPSDGPPRAAGKAHERWTSAPVAHR